MAAKLLSVVLFSRLIDKSVVIPQKSIFELKLILN